VFFLNDVPSRAMMKAYLAQFDEMEVDLVDAALVMMRQASLLIRRLDGLLC
jgi:hypothetical protein